VYFIAPDQGISLYVVSGTAGGVGLVLCVTIVTVGIVICRKFGKSSTNKR